MKIATIVGARPQFIKAAAVSHTLRKKYTEVLIHTGQHYDFNMSDIFFDELNIPIPDYNLGISGGTHAKMTSAMLESIEDVLLREQADMVLVYGDTNSTLAGALAAAKLRIPVCHVEAGVRVGSLTNPEEINRRCTDHISSLLLAPTESALENLARENLQDRSAFVGDPMYDAFLFYSEKAEMPASLIGLDDKKMNTPSKYYYLTCHREENSSKEAINEIFKAAEGLAAPVVYPVHPRNTAVAGTLVPKNVLLIKPVGYLESIALVKNCEKVITDSGGLQREAFWAKKQCVTLFDHIIWHETHIGNRNQLSACKCEEILKKLASAQSVNDDYKPFGDGDSAGKILSSIENFLRKR